MHTHIFPASENIKDFFLGNPYAYDFKTKILTKTAHDHDQQNMGKSVRNLSGRKHVSYCSYFYSA